MPRARSTSPIRPSPSKGTWRNTSTRILILAASFLRHRKVTEAFGVFADAAVQRFRDLQAVIGALEQRLFARAADESDLRQYAGHISADQHHERSLLHSAVFQAGNIMRGQREERALHPRGELPGLV